MGIRASSGGQLGGGNSGGSGGGTGLTVEQVQDIVSESLVTDNLVTGLSLVSTYDDVTGKLLLSLSTPNAPITNVIPASVNVKRSGVVIGAAKSLNFAGSGLGSISVLDDVATINIIGGGGSGGGGVSIIGATINSQGHLILSLDDGNTLDAGSVAGQSGPRGVAGLGIASAIINSLGHLMLTLTDGTVLDTGVAAGAKGDKGDTGTQGEQGVQGIAGRGVAANGAAIDSNGNLQFTLTDGTILSAGRVTGAQGTQGLKGDTGSQGIQGIAGASVMSGTVNASGHLIITKTDGTTIDAGSVLGPQGIQGTQGIQGIQGLTGSAGLGITSTTVNGSGHLIVTRSDGSTLDAGSVIGPQGAQGVKGDTGATGVQGPAGTSYTVNNKSGQVQVYGLGATTQAGYDLEVDIANKANKLSTPRNIALSGKVTGLTSFDGSGNVTMLTTLNGVTTNDVAEGTNQYFTQARARSALSAGTGLSFNAATGVFSLNANSDQINEGTNNLYFTNNRFDNRLGQSTLAQFSDVANTSPTTGQALVWNGNVWAPTNVSSGGGGLTGSGAGVYKATVQVEYDASGNLSNVSILNGGISAVITTATSTTATVTFTFTGSTCAPMGIQIYGYQRTNNVYVTRSLASDFPTRTVAAGGTAGAPTTFSGFDANANTMTLGLTKAVTGASAGIGQTTHCVIQFLLSSI
jgi:hypothetical protein